MARTALRDDPTARAVDEVLDVALSYVARDFTPRAQPTVSDISLQELALAVNILGEELDLGMRGERTIEAQLRHVASIIECSTDAIVAITGPGAISTWNAAAEALFGYTAPEIIGVHVSRLQSPTTGSVEPDWIRALMRGERIRGLETVCLSKSGLPIDVSITMSPIRDTENAVRGGVGFLRDIRERKKSEELRARLAQSRLRAQDEERRRLARELHDETGQSLTALVAGLSSMEGVGDSDMSGRVRELRDLAQTTLANVRRLSHGLHPATLDRLGLGTALERHVEDFSRAHGTHVDLHIDLAGAQLQPEAQIALYRMVQEALTNCAKHARARTISVVVRSAAGSTRVVVEDDGQGFEVGTAGTGLGLLGMRERIEALGGVVEVESAPGEGTTVMTEIPMPGRSEA